MVLHGLESPILGPRLVTRTHSDHILGDSPGSRDNVGWRVRVPPDRGEVGVDSRLVGI